MQIYIRRWRKQHTARLVDMATANRVSSSQNGKTYHFLMANGAVALARFHLQERAGALSAKVVFGFALVMTRLRSDGEMMSNLMQHRRCSNPLTLRNQVCELPAFAKTRISFQALETKRQNEWLAYVQLA